MSDLLSIIRPWAETLLAETGHLDLFDAHTHVGQNDPDGFNQTGDEVLADLETAGARGLVFPMHEPGGYREANDTVVELAQGSEGRLACLCRVNPLLEDAAAEATRALDAGASGIKLHPRSDTFTLAEPAIRELAAIAHERHVPILIHAGRGIPALGRHTVDLASEFTDAGFILAHAAVSDLTWLWREIPSHPNLFIDTSWWNPADFFALFGLVPPGHILWASDSPYGQPLLSFAFQMRYPMALGLGEEALRSIAGGQLERILNGEEPLDPGPAPGAHRVTDPLLERVISNLYVAIGRVFGQSDPTEPISLARLACDVGDDVDHAPVFAAISELLDQTEFHWAEPDPRRPLPNAAGLLILAISVACTPDVPIPS